MFCLDHTSYFLVKCDEYACIVFRLWQYASPDSISYLMFSLLEPFFVISCWHFNGAFPLYSSCKICVAQALWQVLAANGCHLFRTMNFYIVSFRLLSVSLHHFRLFQHARTQGNAITEKVQPRHAITAQSQKTNKPKNGTTTLQQRIHTYHELKELSLAENEARFFAVGVHGSFSQAFCHRLAHMLFQFDFQGVYLSTKYMKYMSDKCSLDGEDSWHTLHK